MYGANATLLDFLNSSQLEINSVLTNRHDHVVVMLYTCILDGPDSNLNCVNRYPDQIFMVFLTLEASVGSWHVT